eukprot:c2415_g1_i1.p1 GENE.c2415_g1_i1~~c2415_g1_i1.p1  ORF type:complete len:177 (+),score=11.82 c2415_g1_i1:41-532(+)
MEPAWKALAVALAGSVSVAKVDCTAMGSRPLCMTYGVQAYPAMMLFEGESQYHYYGPRNVEAWSAFVAAPMGEPTIRPKPMLTASFAKDAGSTSPGDSSAALHVPHATVEHDESRDGLLAHAFWLQLVVLCVLVAVLLFAYRYWYGDSDEPLLPLFTKASKLI